MSCNRSAGPPGGNQVDGLPPALSLKLLVGVVVSEHLGVFCGPAGGRSLRACVPYMARRTVTCGVIPNTGFSSQDGSTKVFLRWGCSSLNFSKSVNSFCEPDFLQVFRVKAFDW